MNLLVRQNDELEWRLRKRARQGMPGFGGLLGKSAWLDINDPAYRQILQQIPIYTRAFSPNVTFSTRLLDWTDSALVALFFALHKHIGTGKPTVWVLDPWWLNKNLRKGIAGPMEGLKPHLIFQIWKNRSQATSPGQEDLQQLSRRTLIAASPYREAGVSTGPIFRAINMAQRIGKTGFSPKVIWGVVKGGSSKCGIDNVAPHDLRRTQRLRNAVNDKIGLEPAQS